MRLAFAIALLTPIALQIEVLRADDTTEAGLSLRYERGGEAEDWSAPDAIVSDFKGNAPAVLSELATEYAAQLAESPLNLLRSIVAERGVQVVWDEKVGKYRPVTTGKHAPQEWLLTGTTLRVEGEPGDDGKATKEVQRKADHCAADAFASESTAPDALEQVMAWRKKGKPLAKLERHTMPDAYAVALVANPSQTKAAAEPVPVKAVGRPAKK